VGEHSNELTLVALLREANELVTRLEAMVRGGAPVAVTPQANEPAPPIPALARLTRRETRVLDLLLLGLSNRQIARTLMIAEPTVKNHLHAIFGKLGVTDRTQAVSVVLRG
jgi:DNA-binding NarL/FixJ family response regulator